jgi:predicted CopG family antitoxin
MSTKTISLRLEAYERLRRARTHPGESFSDVVMRAAWPNTTTNAGEFLDRARERGPVYDAAGIEAVDEAKRADAPSPDKWESA